MTPGGPVLDFPCELSLKVVGQAAADFEAHAVALVQVHAARVVPERGRARASKKGKYAAVTLRVRLESRDKMEALYAALTSDERILWAM